MKLIISRHGDAESISSSGRDRDRKLSSQGKDEIKKMAKFISETSLIPTAIFHSPFTRTTETAELYGKVLKFKKEIIATDNLLPESMYVDIFSEFNRFQNSDTILIVGHNPNVSYFVSKLLSDYDLSRSVPFLTGTTVAINIPIETLTRGQILWFISPDFLK